jgi:hypothetical protein
MRPGDSRAPSIYFNFREKSFTIKYGKKNKSVHSTSEIIHGCIYYWITSIGSVSIF